MSYTPVPGNATATMPNGEIWELGLWVDLDGTNTSVHEYVYGVFIKPVGGAWQVGRAAFSLKEFTPAVLNLPDGSQHVVTFAEAVAMFGAAALAAMYIPKLNAWIAEWYGAGGAPVNGSPQDVAAFNAALQGYKSAPDGLSIIPK